MICMLLLFCVMCKFGNSLHTYVEEELTNKCVQLWVMLTPYYKLEGRREGVGP